MKQGISKIWYACYGSNIREERFLCYIKGGTPAGASKYFKGCTDRTRPEQSRRISIDHEMYFAKESPTWNGVGICFLDPKKDTKAKTLGRTYLITAGQFIDLVKQELKYEGQIEIDFEELKKHGSYNCLKDGRYGLLLYLGEIDGAPVVSFTSEVYLKEEINKPDTAYLHTIIRGLRETYEIEGWEIVGYLEGKPGIRGLFTGRELAEIVKGA